jgi:SAM-dependent methyltransferase
MTTVLSDQLYDDPALARFYDLDNGWGADLDYCYLLAKGARSILDLGCGTGRFLAGLTNPRRVGAEPASAMLEIARARPGGDRVAWIEGDARSLRLGERFDLIVLTGHAFQVFLANADQRAMLATIAAHLSPGGRFVFDSRNPAAEEWREWTPEASRRMLDHPALGQVEAWNDAAENPATGIVTYHTHYRVTATGRTFSAASRIRFTPYARIAALLAEAGLAVDIWLGGWDGRPWTPEAPEIIPIGRLP